MAWVDFSAVLVDHGPHRLPDEADFTYPSAGAERSEAKE